MLCLHRLSPTRNSGHSRDTAESPSHRGSRRRCGAGHARLEARELRRVETADALRRALEGSSWNLAIADYTMPQFSGTKALAMIRDHGIDLPFIFVSGMSSPVLGRIAEPSGASHWPPRCVTGSITINSGWIISRS
jgi:CheY-like chemotaxis protein